MRAALLLPFLPAALSLPELPTARSAPAPTAEPAPIVPRAEATAIWVAIDKDGSPTTTATPYQTTIDGTPTLVDAPPYELTGTVFTWVDHLQKTTSTGSRKPGPTGKGKSGTFVKCFSKHETSPFCEPVNEGQLLVGNTYYVTWDTAYFANERENATEPLQVTLEAHRHAEPGLNASEALGDVSWKTKDPVPARYGVYAWKVPNSALLHKNPTNVTLVLHTMYKDSDDEDAEYKTVEYVGPTVLLAQKPPFRSKGTQKPEGDELYIALPIVGVFIILMIFGTCIWNRKARRIGLGNIAFRSRRGYGAGRKRGKKFGRGSKKAAKNEEAAVMLEDWDGRDSGDLASGEGRNIYREEMERQEREFEARQY
ncbi:uncharacterized protein DNG_10332 [Cephalotrichum gorgonifer]|uniref:Uncharacterized protein n=1 Tax=Cephalotrichum gorgonifer TaxID=2041049 RepID=A0AAE8T0L8_9PEZI|nr:uncharacterized protein DNG_10332 [Cephalotrichum gorgonifer]